MKFEGSEKKLEVILNPRFKNLRSFPSSFFEKLIKKSKAQCLNQFENSQVKAFLLSESSLFVWNHRLILITCGKTTLVEAFLYLIRHIPIQEIEALFFQRKNEFFPLNQKTIFESDVCKIRKKVKGHAYRFGELDEHHFFLFHLNKEFTPSPEDQTIEILMYDIPDNLKKLFFENSSSEQIQSFLNFNKVFPQFILQDHVFKPRGYSLNALRGEEYFTIHLTPQNQGFYMSFETNIKGHIQDIVQKILILFKPLKFDLIVFTPCQSPQPIEFKENYIQTSFYKKKLSCGFDTQFFCFQAVDFKKQIPYEW